MTDDAYRRGVADGLREAVAIVERMQEDVETRLQRPAVTATRNARTVRRQAYRNAVARLTTALRRRERGSASPVDTALKRLCL